MRAAYSRKANSSAGLFVRLALVAALLGMTALLSIASAVAHPSAPSIATVKSVRSGDHQSYTRIVIDLSKSVAYELGQSDDGQELELTLLNSKPAPGVIRTKTVSKSPHASVIKISRPSSKTTRATISLKGSPSRRIFALERPDRLVIDLFHNTKKKSLTRMAQNPLGRTIVIDAGHGGKDPGAIGRTGLKEKVVVLDISRRLKKLLERQGYHIIMTRSDDVFVSLERRSGIANTENADLFISIHANASKSKRLKGVEIYLLGRATDASARATAARENGASTTPGTDLDRIFGDMALDFQINHSISLAHLTRDAFIETVGRRYETVDLGVKRAPFYVLMTSTMPGILAEVSFLSNSVEEARLKRPDYRQTVAEALYQGIETYLRSAAIQS